MSVRPNPVVLCILDGWGHREEPDHNAIAAADTPHWDRLCATYPYGTLSASEGDVGLPEGQMGNSEVGHMNIGAGRVVMQDLPRIDAAIASGELAQHENLTAYCAALTASGGVCHLMGLLSDGGVHSHLNHIIALATIISQAGVAVKLHLFLDGRDTPPRSAAGYVAQCEAALASCANVSIATLCGRYYAMDRDQRWERVALAYAALVQADAPRAESAAEAIAHAYERLDVGDEFIPPVVIGDYVGMKDGDGLVMANFRADRARQLLNALLMPAFDGFERGHVSHFAATLGMVEYAETLNPYLPCLFAPEPLHRLLGEVVSAAGLTQLRIAETEKYAHVTFFFSGGREAPYEGEERILVPSPKVATYDLKPEMSASEVTDHLVQAIEQGRYDLIVVNYANTDMVGHSGDLEAARKAVEAVDGCLGRLSAAVLAQGGVLCITADHGNAECMQDEQTGQPHTAHTLSRVPFVLVGSAFERSPCTIRAGKLADVAPTLLALLGLEKPVEMTGRSLMNGHASAVA